MRRSKLGDVEAVEVGELVQRQVHERARTVLDGLEPLVELGGPLDPLDQVLGHGLAGFDVAGVGAQNLGHQEPMLEQLGRQLDEVRSTLVPASVW